MGCRLGSASRVDTDIQGGQQVGACLSTARDTVVCWRRLDTRAWVAQNSAGDGKETRRLDEPQAQRVRVVARVRDKLNAPGRHNIGSVATLGAVCRDSAVELYGDECQTGSSYKLDAVYGTKTKTQQIFDAEVLPLLQSAVQHQLKVKYTMSPS